jgi:acyl-coenzyme A thioesterase PaaI-like protein
MLLSKICWKETLLLRAFAFHKIPLLFMAGPSVVQIDDESCIISLPFQRRNKNHLGSMYFGALCIGADIAGGIMAARLLKKVKKGKGSLIFKDMQANFLKRAEGTTYFRCVDGARIAEAVKKAEESLERVDLPVKIIATVPSQFEDSPVAEFTLTLSLKVRR